MNLETIQEQLNNPIPTEDKRLPLKPSKIKSLLIGYLYFVQGIMLSLPSTLILTYSNVPSYDVLSWFAAVSLPFSLKFISAPIIEKYTSIRYGRRKTWIVITLLLTSLCTWILSHYTGEQHMMVSAVSFIFVIFLISIQDISTDALGIKELGVPQLVSFLQTLMQQVGLIFGSMVFIKLTSKSFGETLGFSDSLMTPSSYFKMISIIILLPTILIHFSFKQTLLQEQKQMKQDSLLDIFLNYRYFINKNSRYFRQAIVFLFIYSGLNYFEHGYQIQIMKNGFSKQTLNTIQNIILVPLLLFTYLFSYVDTTSKNMFYLRLLVCFRFVWQIVGFLIPSHTTVTLAIFSFINSIFSYTLFIRDMNTVNNFPPSALSGMLITGLYSSRNLGVNGTINLKIISWVGYNNAVIFGLCYTFVIILLIPKITKWIQEGSTDLKKKISLPQDQQKETLKQK